MPQDSHPSSAVHAPSPPGRSTSPISSMGSGSNFLKDRLLSWRLRPDTVFTKVYYPGVTPALSLRAGQIELIKPFQFSQSISNSICSQCSGIRISSSIMWWPWWRCIAAGIVIYICTNQYFHPWVQYTSQFYLWPACRNHKPPMGSCGPDRPCIHLNSSCRIIPGPCLGCQFIYHVFACYRLQCYTAAIYDTCWTSTPPVTAPRAFILRVRFSAEDGKSTVTHLLTCLHWLKRHRSCLCCHSRLQVTALPGLHRRCCHCPYRATLTGPRYISHFSHAAPVVQALRPVLNAQYLLAFIASDFYYYSRN